MRRLIALIAMAALPGCSGDKVVTIEVTTGQETNAFSRDPAVTKVDVTASSPEGDISLSVAAVPGGSFTLGNVPESRLLGLEVAGIDTTGAVAVRGRSLSFMLSSMEDSVLPVFAERIAEWSRPPSQLSHTHILGQGGALGEQFLVLVGGATIPSETTLTAADPAFYDLLGLGPASGVVLPRTPESLMLSSDGVSGVLVGSDGATWVDFSAGTTLELTAPAGLGSFAEVAGGKVVESSSGTRYLVGAARDGDDSNAVLVWAPQQDLALARLAYLRSGAAVGWVEGAGLVVVGGNGSDGVPGVEVLGAGAFGTATRPYAPDPTKGAALVARSGGQFVVLGGSTAAGVAATRLFDAGCGADCVPKELPIPIPARLSSCSAFATDADHAILVGADQDQLVTAGGVTAGLTRTFAVDVINQSVQELELREPRAGAVPVPTPNGLLSMLGGVHPDGTGALSVELLFPTTD